MQHLIHLLTAQHLIVHAHHVWVSAYDGEGWLSARDAAVHVLAHLVRGAR
jgi:hypothetical protein